MATRRSSRLKTQPGPAPVAAPAPAAPPKKRKAPPTKAVAASQKKVARSASAGGKKLSAPSKPGPAKDKLSSLPPEVMNQILDNITDKQTMSRLGRTNKGFYSLIMPRIFGRIAVAAMFHAHIARLIRTLEPHLTIAQKKQLKKEGKYKGQQEGYPTGLDQNAMPICAGQVRQLVVGVGDPGRKHRYIVDRYIEEALKNFKNLEATETYVFNKSIAQSLASLKNLQALRIHAPEHALEPEHVKPLAKIKNLKHLSLHNSMYHSFSGSVVQALLLNSKSTLQSLNVTTSKWQSNFWDDWDNKAAAAGFTAGQRHLSALRSLVFTGFASEATALKSLHQAIDFTRLHHLEVGPLEDPVVPLFESLARVAQDSATDMSLRSLCIRMSDHSFTETPEWIRGNLEARCRFVSSFNTLTSLELHSYGEYDANITINPELPDILLQAILKHKNLTRLRINYNGITSRKTVPYLSPRTVKPIINGLPRLREFEFAPQEAQIDEIGSELARGANLTTVTCYPYGSWSGYPKPERPEFKIVCGIVKGVLNDDRNRMGPFVWEDHSKLKHICVASRRWEIASKFGKSGKGIGKPEKIDGGGKPEVLVRDITGADPWRIHVGYDYRFNWLNMTENNIS